MKKRLAVIILIFLLCGCTAVQTDRETVEDSYTAQAVWLEDAKEILLNLPADAKLISETETASCYTLNDGEFEIVTVRLLCSDASSAIHCLTGFEPQNLNVLRISSSEVYATWLATGEEGSWIYTADILTDGMYSYCVMCSFSENADQRCDGEIMDVFSSFDLSGKNIV